MTDDGRGRIVFLCPFLDMGGAERHWATLLPGLAARDLAVELVAIKRSGRTYELLQGEGISARVLGARGGVASILSLPKLLSERGRRTSAVVTWGFDAHVLGAALARTRRVPQFVHWHRQPGFPLRRREAVGLRLVARSGASVIAVTETQVPELAGLGFPARRTHVAPPGIEAVDTTGADRSVLRARLGLPQEGFVAVLVARLRPEKRIDVFVEALNELKAHSSIHGVVVGDGPEADRLERLVRKLGAPVQLVGHHEHPAEYMLAADAVCLTSDLEALPLTILEGLACGQPIVSTDVGGIHEVVRDGTNGFLVPSGDPLAVAAALAKLVADPGLRDRFGQQSLKIWRDRLSVDAMVDDYLATLTAHMPS